MISLIVCVCSFVCLILVLFQFLFVREIIHLLFFVLVFVRVFQSPQTKKTNLSSSDHHQYVGKIKREYDRCVYLIFSINIPSIVVEK